MWCQKIIDTNIIEDERYLLTAFRYILKNPENAGICSAANYKWSSYSHYEDNSFVKTDVIQNLIGGVENYKKFISGQSNEKCMEDDYNIHNDNWAKRKIKEKLNIDSGIIIQTYDKNRRDEAIRILKRCGLSVRQIERLTGINRGIISRVKCDRRTAPLS